MLTGQWREEQIVITRRTQNSIFLEREEEEFQQETRPCLRFFERAGYLGGGGLLRGKGKKVCESLIIIRGWGGNDEVVKFKKTQATRTENNTQTRSEIQPHRAQI